MNSTHWRDSYEGDKAVGKRVLVGRPYEYLAIDADEIRLLTIQPAESHEPLVCKLSHHLRHSTYVYQAISYTWGSTDRTQTITVDTLYFLKVTDNAYNALRAIRDRDLPRSVWIDLVCIDQDNTSERSAQVGMIGETFRKAAFTTIWLGDPTPEWFEMIEKLGGSDQSRDTATIMSYLVPSLSRREWFRRTWVIQEVMMSGSLFIVMGDQRLPWWTVVHACSSKRIRAPRPPYVVWMHMQFSHEYAKRPVYTFIDAASSLDIDAASSLEALAAADFATHSASAQHGLLNLNYWRLPEILISTRNFGCADPRDKLFAIMSLFARPIPSLLVPDYRKTVSEVYTDLSWFLINYNMAQTLSLACDSYVARSSRVPSWVVDWERPSRRVFDFEGRDHSRIWGRNSFAAGFLAGQRRMFARRHGDLLMLRGRTIDSISSVSDVWREFKHEDTEAEAELPYVMGFVDKWRGCKSVGSPCPQYRAQSQHLPLAVRVSLGLAIELPADASSDHHCADCADSFPEIGPVLLSGMPRRDLLKDTWVLSDQPDWTVCGESQHFFSWVLDHTGTGDQATQPVNSFVALRCEGSRFLASASGLVGVGSNDAREGDIICVLLGVPVPFILRQTEYGWKLIGECLVGGIMYGEAVTHLDWDRITNGELVEPLQDFGIR